MKLGLWTSLRSTLAKLGDARDQIDYFAPGDSFARPVPSYLWKRTLYDRSEDGSSPAAKANVAPKRRHTRISALLSK